MSSDLLMILRVYVISLLGQVLFWPIVRRIFAKSPDQGWAVTRILLGIFVSIVVWQISYFGLAANTESFVIVTTVIVATLGWFLGKKEKVKGEIWRLILLEEYLFLVGLFGISLVRGFLPNIDSLEKFMDYGFVKRYMMSPTLPAMDMWQAGKSINYYSFGHFLASVLVRTWGIDLAYSYNILLGYIAGSSLMISFGVIRKLLGEKIGEKAAAVGALLGSFMVVFGGNGHLVWYFIKNGSMAGYWYADATRFIHNTIHEFPSYSFIVADLHGHLIDLPVVLLFVYLLIEWYKKENRVVEGLLGVVFGVMMMTNTWDLAVYGLLFLMLGLWLLVFRKRDWVSLVYSAITVSLFGVGTFIFWWWQFTPISGGVGKVILRSPLWQLGVLWSLGLITNLLVWIFYKGSNKMFVKTASLLSLILIVIPEFVYVKDIYPDHPRANTMFKLTYQSSILIGIIWGVVAGYLFDTSHELGVWKRSLGVTLILLVFISSLSFPTVGFTAFYENFKSYKGLNGEEWLTKESPGKWGAISYLRKSDKEGNILEAVGDSYTKFNAVSVFSGRPTIQGWRVHEWLWRGGYTSVAEREHQVREIYEKGEREKSKFLLKLYGVRWILVGDDERKMYEIDEDKVKSLGVIVWSLGDSYLVEVR